MPPTFQLVTPIANDRYQVVYKPTSADNWTNAPRGCTPRSKRPTHTRRRWCSRRRTPIRRKCSRRPWRTSPSTHATKDR